MAFGQGIAQSFEIPLPQQQRVAAGGGAGAGARTAKAEEYNLQALGLDKGPAFDLQSTSNVGDRMSQYYADYADVVSFAKTMHKNYGIDVMAPDPRSEFSVRASEQFQKKLANLWATQNVAKNSEIAQQSLYNSGLSGAVDVNQAQAFGQGQFLNEVPMDQQFVSNRLPDYLEKGGAKTSRAVDNSTDLGRLNKDWEAMVTQTQNVYQAAKTEENKRRLEFVMTQRPTFNTEGQGKASGGNDFVRQQLEKVALLSKGSTMYFKPTNKPDAGGAMIRTSDQYKGQPFGYYDVVDKSGRKIKAQFVIDHLEHRPGEGGVFAVNENGEKVPFSEKGVLESMKSLGYVSQSQMFKFMEDAGLSDTSTADQFISEPNRQTIPVTEELTGATGPVTEQRGQVTQEVGRGSNWFQRNIPLIDLEATKFKDSSGNEVNVETPGAGTAKLTGVEWKKVFGNETDVVVDGKTITKTQAMNGIPAQVMVRLLEEKGFITYSEGPKKGDTKKLSTGTVVTFDGTSWK